MLKRNPANAWKNFPPKRCLSRQGDTVGRISIHALKRHGAAAALFAGLMAPAAQAQVVIYQETFDNGNGTVASPRLVNTYVGPAPNSVSYTADPAWLMSCNGWVAAANSPATAAAPSASCGSQVTWNYVQAMSQALGVYNGQATPGNNLAVTATTSALAFPVPSTILENTTVIAFTTPTGGTGRFVTLKLDAAAQNCANAAPPIVQFYLVSGATALPLGNPFNYCTDGTNAQTVATPAVGDAPASSARVARYTPTGTDAGLLVTTPGLRFRVTNLQPTGVGNDWALDNFVVLDVSPSLTKAAPALHYVGQAKPLTFTITNTPADNTAKVGWGFTDTLPAGVTVAATPGVANTCGGTVTATAGAGTITIANGSLAAGTPGGTATACTLTVNVVSGTVGSFANGAANITTSTGLNLPVASTLMEWVQNRLTVTKISNGGTGTFGFSGNNGIAAHSIATAAPGAPGTAGTQQLLTAASITANTTVSESTLPVGWQLTGTPTCTGLATGQTPTFNAATRTLTLPFAGLSLVSGGRNVQCAFTNTRDPLVTLRKTWINAIAGNAVSLAISGAGVSGATAGTSTAPATTTNASAMATAGSTVTLTEAFTTGNAANYATTLACTDANNANVAVTGAGLSRTIAMPATAVTCTYTNSRIAQPLNLVKDWAANAAPGHTATVTTTGGSNNPSFNAIAPTDQTGVAVTVFAGDVVTLPAETFGGGATAANYGVAVACAGGTALAGGATGRTLTIAASTTATTCTYTNTPQAVALTLRKRWAGATTGDDATITLSRGGTVVGTFASNADAADELDTDPATASVFAGETVTLAETLAAGNAGLYDGTLACTGAADANPNDGLTIAAADTAIVCTFSNTRRSADLAITKTNTPAAGPSDQSGDTVVAGAGTMYTLTVSNRGATAVTGAVVRDTPQAGLNCPGSNPVTCSGAACPGGAITVANLSSGVTLGALAAGASATLGFSCTVQ